MITQNCALLKKSLSAVALSLAFQSPYALAMEKEQNESALSSAVLSGDCLRNVILDSDLDTKINGWSLTCSKLRHFTLGTIFEIPDDKMKGIRDFHFALFPNLNGLNLEDNSTITNEALSRLINLTQLDLASNRTIKDETLYLLNNLNQLGLCFNYRITDRGLSHLTNLTQLDLTCNFKITDGGLSHLTKITQLDLGDNTGITDEALNRHTNLIQLDLTGNRIITDKALLSLTNLTRLNLAHNRTIADAELGCLTNLTQLNLCNNDKITYEGLKYLVNLTQLDLCDSHNTITKEALSHLTKLVYFNNKISDQKAGSCITPFIKIISTNMCFKANIRLK